MSALYLWIAIYSLVVALSIFFLGKPSLILGALSAKTFLFLLIDWRFLLGGFLALMARFIFVIINNTAARLPQLAESHLTVTALATTGSIIFIALINSLFLSERLTLIQISGGVLLVLSMFLIVK